MSDTVRLTHKQLWTFPDGPDHVAEAAERLEEEAKKRGKTCVMDFNDIDLRVVPGVTTAARAVMDWQTTAAIERFDALTAEAKVMRARIAELTAKLDALALRIVDAETALRVAETERDAVTYNLACIDRKTFDEVHGADAVLLRSAWWDQPPEATDLGRAVVTALAARVRAKRQAQQDK